LGLDGYVATAPDVTHGFADIVSRASGLGYQISPVRLSFDALAVAQTFGLVCAIRTARYLNDLLSCPTPQVSAGLEQTLASVFGIPASGPAEACEILASAAETVLAAMATHAAMLAPTTPDVAPHFGPKAESLDVVAITMLANITGMPAMAFPTGLDGSGLTLSVQAMGLESDTVLTLTVVLGTNISAADLSCTLDVT